MADWTMHRAKRPSDWKGQRHATALRAWMLALLWAAPLELVLTAQFTYPLDKGFDANVSWMARRLCDLWLAAHWPGLMALRWMESRNCGPGSEMLVVLGSGYLILALMVLAAILAWRWIWGRFARSGANSVLQGTRELETEETVGRDGRMHAGEETGCRG